MRFASDRGGWTDKAPLVLLHCNFEHLLLFRIVDVAPPCKVSVYREKDNEIISKTLIIKRIFKFVLNIRRNIRPRDLFKQTNSY